MFCECDSNGHCWALYNQKKVVYFSLSFLQNVVSVREM